MRACSASVRWLEFAVDALASIARRLGRSSGQFARKVIALVLVEAVAVSSAVSVVAGPTLALPHQHGAITAQQLASLWAQNPRWGQANHDFLAGNQLSFLTSLTNPALSPTKVSTAPWEMTAAGHPNGRVPPIYAFFTGPVISNLTPNAGAVGTSVTISGSGFGTTQGTSSINFGSLHPAPTSWSASSIVFPVPSGAATSSVSVTVSGKTSNAGTFTVTPPPSISSLSPTSGIVGSSVTINGSNFGSPPGGVTFNGISAGFTSWSVITIVAIVPDGATSGNVVVTTAGGVASNGVNFNVIPPPGISLLQPNSGAPGTTVTISGANFGSSQGNGSVTFNGAPANILSWSDTSIQTTVPAGATTGNIVVTGSSGAISAGAHFIVVNPGGVSVDQVVTGGSFTPVFSTNSGNELLLAFVATAPGFSGVNSTVSSISGGNLTWTLVKRTNVQSGTAEIWRAFSPAALSNVLVSATLTGASDVSMTIVTFMGVDTSGTNGSGAIGATGTANGGSGTPAATLTTTRNNSLVFGVAEDPVSAVFPAPGANQTIVNLMNSCTGTPPVCTQPGDTFWVQQVATSVPSSGTAVTLVDTNPASDPFNISAVEVLPATSPSTAPLITSLSAIAGSPGTSITIGGEGFGTVQGASTVTFNGTAATPSSWSATSIVVPVPSGATTGNVVVTVGGVSSNGLRFIVANAGGLAIDRIFRSFPQTFTASALGGTFSTSSGNEVLLALVGTAPNGATGGTTITPLQGGGLNWVRVEIANTQAGTAEVWRAFSPYILSNVSVSYSPGPSTDTLITVVALLGADTSGTSGSGAIGAIATANAASGAPSATLTSTRANSFVFGVGDDPSAGVSRTLGANQTSLAQAVNNRCSGSVCQPGSYTLWSQQLTSSIAAPGTSVTINDTAPTADAFNLSIVEVRPPASVAPTITSLSPTAGPAGTVVTIAGSNFGASQGTSTVTFAGVTAVPNSWSSTSIVVPVPSGVPLGPAAVVVTVPGAGASQPATFTVVAPLAITASSAPAANTAHWNNTNVTISYTCTGGVTPVQCPASQTVTTEGANQSFTATATDANNNAASVTTTLNIDKTPPALAITSPANNATVTSSPVQVSGTVTDNLSGVASVACNSAAATVQSGTFSCSVALAPGPNTISVLAFDVAGNSATRSITVTLGPAITDFNPKVGPAGTAVSIVGTNLSVPPNATTVTFAGPSGPLTAKVNFASATQLAVVVPTGAVTGPITISNAAGTASTASPFTVGPSQDFQVTVAPATATLPQGSVTSLAVSVSSQQSSFTQLATLSVSGMPQGVAATFNPPQITAGAGSTLLIDLGASTLAVGTFPFTIHATATVAGAQQDRTAGATLNVTAAGQTTLAGQVVTTLNQPIVGATVSLDGLSVLTDGAGRFLLTGIQPGTGRPLSIDGHSASSPNATFPLIFEPVNIIIGRANVVSTPFHLPPIDTSQEVTVNPNADTVAGNAAVPGLQMTIPKGANLRMLDGTLVTRTSITPLAPDRTPAPLPSTVGTNIVYTSQPGGAITSIPIPVVYPNLAGLNPGTEVDLWAFDHAHVSWFIYGKGQVSTDGRTINPEINPATGKPYGLPDFSWHFPNTGPGGNPSDGCQDPGPSCDTDNPVNLATGLKVERVPLVSWGGARGGIDFSLVYTTDKAATCLSGSSCPFGDGWTSNWDIRLSGSFAPGGAGRLIMPQELTGRLFSSSAPGTFTSTAAVSRLGESILNVSSASTPLQYRQKDGTVFNFNSAGRLVSKVDRNGNTTTLTYSNGNLTQITDPVGRSLTFTYDGNNHVTSMTDPLGRTWRYSQGGVLGQLLNITDPVGNVTAFTYTGARVASVLDANGNTVKKLTYDSNGRVITQTFADGGLETYSYSLSGTIVTGATITNPLGNTRSMRFSAANYVLGTTDELGQSHGYNRDLTTNLATSTIGPCNCTEATRQYDTNGNLLSETDRLGNTKIYQYDPTFNQVTQKIDKRGNKTTYTYDVKGNLLAKTDALNKTTTYSYDTFGELTSITDPLGHTLHMEYDANGNMTALVDALGNRSVFQPDILGRQLSVADPLGRKTTFQYDALSRVVAVTDAAAATAHYAYDANGNLISIIDGLGNRTTMAYDAKNRLVATTDPVGGVTRYQYDKKDELTATISPLGRVNAKTSDARGNLASTSDPSGGVVTYTYDNNNNLVTLGDERGNTTRFTYDALYRLISTQDPDGNSATVAYDANGNAVQKVDRLGRSTTVTYDALNRVQTISFPDSTVSYTYDAAGRATRLDDSRSGSLQWSYDDANRLLAETQAAGAVQYTYDAAGGRASMTFPGRPPVNYAYDAAGRLSTITQASETFTYSYDALSRVAGLQRPNAIASGYGYDPAGRLVQLAHGTNGSIENFGYSFTADNQIASITSLVAASLVPPSTSFSAADPANRIAQVGADTFSFDAEGQTTSDSNPQGTSQYLYDARGRLVQVTLPNGQAVTYQYDGVDRRVSRTVNGATTQFLYDNQDVVLDLNSDGSTADYLNGPGIDQKLRQRSSSTGGLLYFLQDHLGSTVALTDANGTVAEREHYQAYGASAGSGLTRYLYTGRELDSATGLIYYRARYYDPQAGRFISEDPFRFGSDTVNFYAYVGNDPVDAADPYGLCPPDKQCFAQLKCRFVNDWRARAFSRTHCFWYVQGSSGTQYILGAGPNPPGGNNRMLNVWPPNPNTQTGVDNRNAGTSWDSGTSAANCPGVDAMIAAAVGWPQNTIPYHDVTGPNSDTAAHYLGQQGGFNPPAPAGVAGWNTPLPPMPTPTPTPKPH